MYEVHSISPLDERWEARDAELRDIAGKPARSETHGKRRLHCWMATDMDRAQLLKALLERVDDTVNVTIREH